MKNSMVCPKCRSKRIIRVGGYTGAYGAGNNIRVGISNYKTVNVNRYVCCDCGYSEEWIDKEDIPALLNRYGTQR